MLALRRVLPQAWSIDIKYWCLGLIAAKTLDFEKAGGWGGGSPFSAIRFGKK
jgi:hypothetical protein